MYIIVTLLRNLEFDKYTYYKEISDLYIMCRLQSYTYVDTVFF